MFPFPSPKEVAQSVEILDRVVRHHLEEPFQPLKLSADELSALITVVEAVR